MEMTITSAVFATLLAAFLFASWYQCLKHLGDYPLAGFVLWLYISSFITILIAVNLLKGDMPNGIMAELEGKGLMALGVMLGGTSMTWGLIVSLNHMKKFGMVANMAIMGTVGSIVGLAVTFIVGGLSPSVSLPLVLVSAAVLLIASFITQYSTTIKAIDTLPNFSEDKKSNGLEVADEDITKELLIKQNLMLIGSTVLTTGYSIAYMLGTRSQLHPNGFPPILCVFLLATGSLIGAVSYSSVSLTRNKQWKIALNPDNKLPIILAVISGVCHYGGNLLTIYSLPLLSAPVSNLLQRTSGIWTYFWGLAYGEYNGASRKSKVYLAIGVGIYILGTVMLTSGLY